MISNQLQQFFETGPYDLAMVGQDPFSQSPSLGNSPTMAANMTFMPATMPVRASQQGHSRGGSISSTSTAVSFGEGAQVPMAGPETEYIKQELTLSPAMQQITPPSESDATPVEAPAVAADPAAGKAAKPKRKRENRYKNAPPAVLSRRRAQNRASQRAYRERKDQRIRDLEQALEELRTLNESLKTQMGQVLAANLAGRVGQAVRGQDARTQSMSAIPNHHQGHIQQQPLPPAMAYGNPQMFMAPSTPNMAPNMVSMPSNNMMTGMPPQGGYITLPNGAQVPPGFNMQ